MSSMTKDEAVNLALDCGAFRWPEATMYEMTADGLAKFAEMVVAADRALGAGMALEIPAGAIHNGFALIERLNNYGFECQGGPLEKCSDWQHLVQCFTHLADWGAHSNHPSAAVPDGWRDMIAAAYLAGSGHGHNTTVEGYWSEDDELAYEYADEMLPAAPKPDGGA